MIFSAFIENILHPPVLFFFLGIFACLVRSNLEIPPQVGKLLSLYLLFDIGIKGGQELFHSGLTVEAFQTIFACVLLSFLLPFLAFFILRWKLDTVNASAIAATYGSISAVTFATTISFLEANSQSFNGYMVAGMALMESPAIIAGLIIYGFMSNRSAKSPTMNVKGLLHEAFFNGSVLLLMGSLVIGLVCGDTGEKELGPFVSGIFKGMLSLYMLDMGLLAGSRLGGLRSSGVFLVCFAIFFAMFSGLVGMATAALLGLGVGNALLLTILTGSASYIAVPAAMRISLPKANMSLLLPMSLGVTFTFNVTIGIPLYFRTIEFLWR